MDSKKRLMNRVPSRNWEVWYEDDDGYVIAYTKGDFKMILNRMASLIWGGINGKNSIMDIVNQVKMHYGSAVGEPDDSVLSALEEMERLNLISLTEIKLWRKS